MTEPTATDGGGEYDALRTACGIVDRSDRGLVVVSGSDGLSFLQSLLSQDLDGLADGDGVHALLLQPQGKLTADVRVLRVGDECWLDCDPGVGATLAAALTRFRIRVDATIEDRSAATGCLTVAGPQSAAVVSAALGVDPPVARLAHLALPTDSSVRVVRAAPPLDAYDIIGPTTALGPVFDALVAAGARPCGANAYEALRIEAGIPRQGLDIDERTIPQEAFLEVDAVSFTKGCFLGQELVCRIDTRGHVNRYLRRVQMPAGSTVPEIGADIVVDGAVVGVLTSAASTGPDRGPVGLAMVRREVEPPVSVIVRDAHGAVGAELVVRDGAPT